MIWTIARREIHNNLISSKFALATILCLILIVLGSYVSIKDYERRMSEYSIGVQEQKGENAAFFPKIYKKPEMLGVFSQGMERKLGRVVDSKDYFWEGKLNLTGEMRVRGTRQSAYLKNLAPVDFNFVVRVVMSLLAIFLAYDAISGEREAGVLKLTMANAVSRSHILVGKFLGGVFCMCIPFIMSAIVAVLMMQLSHTAQFGTAEWIRLGAILSLSIVYLVGSYALGLLVSCLTKTSATSLTVSMLIWILVLVIVPNVGPAMVKRFWQITPRGEMVRQRDQLDKEYMKTTRLWDKRDGSRKGEAEFQILMHGRARSLWRLSQQHKRELDQQTEAGRWVARLSPSSVFSFATSAFARTDVKTYDRFMQNVYMFFTETESLRNLAFEGKMKEYRDRAGAYRYSFKMSESVADSFRDAAPDVALLLLFAVLLFMGAYASFIRCDVS